MTASVAGVVELGESEEQGESERGLEDAGDEDEPESGSGEQRCARRSRPALHHAGVAVDAECERGRSVGDDVDPQQLGGGERDEEVAGCVAQIADRGTDDADRDEDDERDVGGEQEAEELLDVVVDAAAFFDGGGDGREVVVEQDEVGDFAADTSLPRWPIATPTSARLSAGASLTPSPVMATISPRALSASTRASLCSGLTRAKTWTSATASLNCVGFELVEFVAGEGSVGGDPEVGGDRLCGRGMVTGDHQHSDAGRLRGGDRGVDLGAGRIPQRDRLRAR